MSQLGMIPLEAVQLLLELGVVVVRVNLHLGLAQH